MKRSALVILALTALIVVSLAFTNDKPPRYKNIKVLPKNIDKHQLDSVMFHFTGALGVKCDHCHVRLN
ncbi:MAG: c-type cytochrome, partial [Chitinophagaceae bacterium]|nr:c-type cytochrome [Chitinophagaceae bacterium]